MHPFLNEYARTVVGVQRHISSVRRTTEESPCGGRGHRLPCKSREKPWNMATPVRRQTITDT